MDPLRLVLRDPPTDLRRRDDLTTGAGVTALFLTAPTPRLLIGQAILLWAVRVAVGGWSPADLLVVAAIVSVWPVQEWAAHRWLLHFRPFRVGALTVDPLAARIHRFHHRETWRFETVFVPWPVIVALIPVNVAAWALLLPWPLAATAMCAYATCAVVYEWIHLVAHVPWRPASAWLRGVQKHHRAHHFKNEQRWFAFSVPLLDELGGTGGDPREVPTSQTTRTLGIDG